MKNYVNQHVTEIKEVEPMMTHFILMFRSRKEICELTSGFTVESRDFLDLNTNPLSILTPFHTFSAYLSVLYGFRNSCED